MHHHLLFSARLLAIALLVTVTGSRLTGGSPAMAQSDVETGLNVFPSLNLGGVTPATGQHAAFSASLQRTASDRGTLSVTAKMDPEWHLYSLTQKAGGPTPTKIELVSQPGIRLIDALQPNQPPHVVSNEAWPGLPIEQHEDEVTWTAQVELSADYAGPAEVKIRSLVCQDDGACQPLNQTLKVELVSAPAMSAEASQPETEPSAESTSPSPTAPATTPFRAPEYVIEWTAALEPASAKAGQRVRLVISAKPDSGYHLYTAATDDRDFATNFVVTEKSGLLIGSPTTENEPVVEPAAVPGLPELEFHEGIVTWELPIQIPAEATPGEKKIEGYIAYSACDDTACLIPQGLKFTAVLPVDSPSAPAPVQLVAHGLSAVKDFAAETKWVDKLADATAVKPNDSDSAATPSEPTGTDANLAQSPTRTDKPSANNAEAKTPAAAPESLPAGLETPRTAEASLSLPMALLFALVGGLILNLMPCVLPVVGLKIMAFAEQAGESRARVLWLNLWYSLGILAVFWILAAVAISFSQSIDGTASNFSWGQQFTYMEFRLGLTILVFAMALSFLGVWEIPIPGFVGGHATQKLQRKEGVSGAFFKGIFTTLLATPCSGPLLGPVFGFMLGKPSYVILTVFTAIGLGMALPYLLVAVFPRLVAFLPKPGAWMDTFKQLLAFLLLGTVVFLFNGFADQDHLAVLATLFGVWFGCWIVGQVPAWEAIQRRIVAWSGGLIAASLIGLASFHYLTPKPAVLNWEPYSEARLQQLQREGKPVMIDFTAKWCANCIVNYKVAINTPETSQLVAELGAVPMLADMTDPNDEISKKLVELQSNSIPVLAIYPGGQATEPIVLRDLLTQSQVSRALQQAGELRRGGRLTSVSQTQPASGQDATARPTPVH